MFDDDIYDIVIIGCGPAGMTAALYACRANKSVCVIEKDAFGGQITHSPKVENYPGTMVMSGNEFASKLLEQITAAGAEVVMGDVTGIKSFGDIKMVETKDGTSYEAKTVIIASGSKHRMLGLSNEKELIGHGLHFCAVCDGNIYAGRKAVVIGGGNSALQEAVMLSELCSELVIVQNLTFLTGEMKLQETLQTKQNTSVILSTIVEAYIEKDGQLCGLKLLNTETGEHSEIACDGAFLAVGLEPQNKPFTNMVKLNEYGYIDVDENCAAPSKGIFVAGDCRSKRIRQITTAASDGAIAALGACRFLDN